MRKPRDYDSELHELAERSKQLKARRVQQFGELVIATGADALGASSSLGPCSSPSVLTLERRRRSA